MAALLLLTPTLSAAAASVPPGCTARTNNTYVKLLEASRSKRSARTPGHTPTLFAGSEIVEFHPTEALMQTTEVVTRNMEAAG